MSQCANIESYVRYMDKSQQLEVMRAMLEGRRPLISEDDCERWAKQLLRHKFDIEIRLAMAQLRSDELSSQEAAKN